MRHIMKGIPLLGIFFILVAFTSASREPVGKITFPLNRVFVIPEGTSDLKMAYFNMDVFSGDKIETKRESRCEITLTNGDVVRIDENSLYTLEDIEVTQETVKASSFLSVGKLWATIRKIFTEDDYVAVKSPTAVIAVRGTIYRVDVAEDSMTTLRVYDGEVEVKPAAAGIGKLQQSKPERTGPIGPPRDVPGPRDVAGPRDVSEAQWIEIVKAQQQIRISSDGKFEKSDFDLIDDAKSDWVQWNKQRDELLNR
ncbi:MAG: FecR domain-containing protein [Calditrichaeota bacterium]|nr:FecR domain-containing protein [Calditrichota bacterium]